MDSWKHPRWKPCKCACEGRDRENRQASGLPISEGHDLPLANARRPFTGDWREARYLDQPRRAEVDTHWENRGGGAGTRGGERRREAERGHLPPTRQGHPPEGGRPPHDKPSCQPPLFHSRAGRPPSLGGEAPHPQPTPNQRSDLCTTEPAHKFRQGKRTACDAPDAQNPAHAHHTEPHTPHTNPHHPRRWR